MPACPQCNKNLVELTRRCPSCMADLDLLVDYVSHLQGGLERAENLTRAGELAQAVWAYLEVLEVDPDNSTARQKVGQVVTAVRQFDQAAPGRRWLGDIRGNFKGEKLLFWLRILLGAGLLLGAFTLGYSLGGREESDADKTPPAKVTPKIDRPATKSMTGD